MRFIQPLVKPIKYTLAVPGSKSALNRALVCAALARGTSTIYNPNYCEDVVYLIKALQQLGLKIVTSEQKIIINGTGGKFIFSKRSLYVGNAGTATRFLVPFIPVGTRLTGNTSMQRRPLTDLLTALEQLGYEFECPTQAPPIKILNRLSKKVSKITLNGQMSSQYVTALLLLAPTLSYPLTIQIKEKLVSRPYIDMTLNTLQQFGITIPNNKYRNFYSTSQQYKPVSFTTPGDASSATYWWALAAITGSSITVENINSKDTTQADLKILPALQSMGCNIQGTTVTGTEQLKPINIDATEFPDAVLTLAIVAACASGKSVIKGIERLTIKESDRLGGLVYNLRQVGIKAKATRNAITIAGNPKTIHGGYIKTFNDHRFAMAFAILGLRTGNMNIDQPQCVKKSYPDFWKQLRAIQQHAKTQTIVLTGMRASGKTTLAKQWAQHTSAKCIDIDQLIEKKVGQPIANYVEQHGWKKFRDIEHQVVQSLPTINNAIIASGGGTIIFPRNYKLLKHYYIIYLNMPLNVLKQRLKHDYARPGLQSSDSIQELSSVLQQRISKYLATADRIYDSR